MVSVYEDLPTKDPTMTGVKGSVCLPAVFKAPIRPDIVSFIHHEVAKNRRQPYCVNRDAGKYKDGVVGKTSHSEKRRFFSSC